jgi:hypothetical protein
MCRQSASCPATRGRNHTVSHVFCVAVLTLAQKSRTCPLQPRRPAHPRLLLWRPDHQAMGYQHRPGPNHPEAPRYGAESVVERQWLDAGDHLPGQEAARLGCASGEASARVCGPRGRQKQPRRVDGRAQPYCHDRLLEDERAADRSVGARPERPHRRLHLARLHLGRVHAFLGYVKNILVF